MAWIMMMMMMMMMMLVMMMMILMMMMMRMMMMMMLMMMMRMMMMMLKTKRKHVYENGPRFGAGFRDGNKRTARAHGTVRELSLSAVFGARSRPQNWGRVVARSS